MSDQFPSLSDVLCSHRIYAVCVIPASFQGPGAYEYRCGGVGCSWSTMDLDTITEKLAEHQAEVWREACTVTDVGQLAALPDRTVILDVDGGVLRRNPWHSEDPGNWYPLDGYDAYTRDFGIAAEDIDLPARVIHNPDWETK